MRKMLLYLINIYVDKVLDSVLDFSLQRVPEGSEYAPALRLDGNETAPAQSEGEDQVLRVSLPGD